MRKRIVLAVLAVIVGATGLAAAALIEVPVETPAAPFVVPVGHMGDTLQYGGEQTETDTAPEELRMAVQVDGTSRTVDAWGGERDVLLLRDRMDPAPITADGPVLQGRSHVDLMTRDVVRRDSFLNTDFVGNEAVNGSGLQTDSVFGPTGGPGVLGLNHSLLRYQGLHIADGPMVGRSCTHPGGRFTVDQQGWTDLGQFEGVPAAKVHQRTTYWYLGPDGERVTGTDEETALLVSTIPYPVRWTLQRTEDRPEGPYWSTRSLHLEDYTAGETPIPWGTPGGCGPMPPALERSDGLFPQEGSVPNAEYPQARALEHIESHPSMAAFQAWRLAHPDNRIVGFTYRAHRDDEPSNAAVNEGWMFWYASGPDVAVVHSYLTPAGEPVSHMSWIDRFGTLDRPPAIRDDELAPAPITLTSLQALWALIAAPTYVRQDYNGANFGITGPQYGQPFDAPWERQLDYVSVGHNDGLNPFQAEGGIYDSLQWNLHRNELDHYWAVSLNGIIEPPEQDETESLSDLHFKPGRTVAAQFGALPVGSTTLLMLGLSLLALPAVREAVQGWLFSRGYAKIQGEELLRHETRARLQSLVALEPGISPPQLQAETGVPWSTLGHHLRVLERDGFVQVVRQGRHRRVFPKGTAPAARRQAATLRDPTTSALFAQVQNSPGMSQAEAARRLGVTPQAITRHVRRLLEAGLLERGRSGKAATLHPRIPSDPDAALA